MKISVVIPAYNEAENLRKTLQDLQTCLLKITPAYEIIIVDDHSSDDTFNEAARHKNQNITCIRLSRRSGSHTAIRAGLQHAQGDVALCIAADGQEDPGILKEMIAKWQNGSQIVWGIRKERNENFTTKLFAEIFYKILNMATDKKDQHINLANADFFFLDRLVAQALNKITERNTSLFGLLSWIGFQHDAVEYDRQPRRQGKSKWSFKRRLNLAFDWIFAFSTFPLKLMLTISGLFIFIGFLYTLYVLNTLHSPPAHGEPSVIIVILITGALQMLMLSILGAYLWRSLEESKKRPLFFIEKTTSD